MQFQSPHSPIAKRIQSRSIHHMGGYLGWNKPRENVVIFKWSMFIDWNMGMIKKQPFISQFVVYCSRFVVVWHWLILPIFSRLFNKNKRTKPNQEGNPLWLLVFLFNIVDSLAPGKRGSNLIRTAFDTHLPDGYDAHIPWTWWRHLMETFPRYWPFVRGIHRSPVNSPHKGQWHGALIFSLICVWINGWVNNCEAGDLRRHRAHYDVIVMKLLPYEWYRTPLMTD